MFKEINLRNHSSLHKLFYSLAVNELSRQKWLNNEYSNNVPTIITLNTESIAFMQTRFSRGLKQVIDELSKIKSLIF